VVTTERYLGCKQNLEEDSERPFRMPLRIQAGRFALSPANRPVDMQLSVILEFVSHEADALRQGTAVLISTVRITRPCSSFLTILLHRSDTFSASNGVFNPLQAMRWSSAGVISAF
jgi:hypothetical protein